MKKFQNNSHRASALQMTISAALISISALLMASSLKAASSGGGTLQWDDDGAGFKRFGPNEVVSIYIGTIDFQCDAFFPTADIYVMDHTPIAGEMLVDVSGAPNTVFGASGGLFSDIIAFTKPSGNLGPGLYTVVYDECQDGMLNPGDEVFPNAFEVVIPVDVPPIDASIVHLKTHAATQAHQAQHFVDSLDDLKEVKDYADAIQCLLNFSPLDCIASKALGGLAQKYIDFIKQSLGLAPDVQGLARDYAADNVKHYIGINADPADPDFRRHTLLGSIEPIDPQTNEGLTLAQVELGNAMASEAALNQALLTAIERYQGARQASDGNWALVHAREIEKYSRLLASQLGKTNSALDGLSSALDSDPRDLDGFAPFLGTELQRIASTGFGSKQRALIASLHLDKPTTDLLALAAGEGARVGSFTRAGFNTAIVDLKTANSDSVPVLQTLATDVAAIAAQLAADPSVLDDFPRADAGGPYTAGEGQSIVLAGTAIIPSGHIVSASWDLNRDGVFNDATGLTPTVSFPRDFKGLIGLRVVDNHGKEAIAYAEIKIADTNQSPVITSSSPTDSALKVYVGSNQTFSVAASDPEGGTVTTEWQLDGTTVANGPTFNYTPTAANVGIRILEAVVSDGASTVRQAWTPWVVQPDADGDGWSEDVDCDDNNPNVNPGMPEIFFNGIDDDCNPATPDNGLVSWWRAEGNALDSAGSNHGILQNGVIFAPGISGQGFLLNGVNQYIELPHSVSLPGSFTLDAWVKTTSSGSTFPGVTVFPAQAIVSYFDCGGSCPVCAGELSAGSYMDLWVILGHLYAPVRDDVCDEGDTQNAGGCTFLADGQFHHVVVVRDVALNELRNYVDGNLEGRVMLTESGPLIDFDGEPDFFIGAREPGGSHEKVILFNGIIDEVRLFDRALSEGEIRNYYETTSGRSRPPGCFPGITVDAGPDRAVAVSELLSLTPATFTDLHPEAAPHLASIDWGDGSTVEDGTVTETPGSGAVASSHAYAFTGTYTVTVIVANPEGISGRDTFNVTVGTGNLRPRLAAMDATTMNEGGHLTLFVCAIDPEANPITLQASGLPPYGTLTDQGDGFGSLSFAPPDDDMAHVTLTACDAGGCSTETLDLTVLNVPPLAEAENNGPILQGGSVTITVHQVDPGVLDTHEYAFDCDNTGNFSPYQSSNTYFCSFASAGNHIVGVRVRDNDDGVGSATTQVIVLGQTGTPTPTPPPTVNISGDISYCSNSDPVPLVSLTLTGSASDSTMSGSSGSYQFLSLAAGGSYIVTPSKSALTPGSGGINTMDVMATQRHFLTIALIPPGCGRDAADVNGDNRIDTSDVVAIQRFFLGRPFGFANVGKYQFTPANRNYPGIVTDQTSQNYDALVLGDVASGFVHRPGGPSQDAAGDDMLSREVDSTVEAVTLPEVVVDQPKSNFIAAVTTSPIDARHKLVGFQGDFTFDERVVSFQSEPVQKAGITASNWNVSGNVLPGAGPIRTLRVSAYSNDFTPLSGSGTLFELRIGRVSKAAQATQLTWAARPDHFIFIDADLNTQKPGNAAPGNVIQAKKR